MKSVRQVIQSNLDLICALTSYARGDGVFSSHHVLNDSVCGYASDAAALVLGLHDIVPQRVSVMCTGSTDHQLKGCNNHEYLLIGNEVLDMTYRQYAHTFEFSNYSPFLLLLARRIPSFATKVARAIDPQNHKLVKTYTALWLARQTCESVGISYYVDIEPAVVTPESMADRCECRESRITQIIDVYYQN